MRLVRRRLVAPNPAAARQVLPGPVCEAWQRSRLERLCRYITRPPIATKRLSVDTRGWVVYRYKQPFRDGSTRVILEPLDFVAQLAALVPRPRLNLTRFHGVFRSWPRLCDNSPFASSNLTRLHQLPRLGI
jgi:hypothetical protein